MRVYATLLLAGAMMLMSVGAAGADCKAQDDEWVLAHAAFAEAIGAPDNEESRQITQRFVEAGQARNNCLQKQVADSEMQRSPVRKEAHAEPPR